MLVAMLYVWFFCVYNVRYALPTEELPGVEWKHVCLVHIPNAVELAAAYGLGVQSYHLVDVAELRLVFACLCFHL